MKAKILVTRKLSDAAEEKLRKDFDVTLNPNDEPIPNDKLIKMANEYDGFISTGFDKIGEEFFKDLNGKLKIIAQVGVGYDNISVKSAESKKIKVTNTPNVLNEAVAETTILLILAASRRIGEAYNLVRSGTWKDQKPDLTKFMIGNSVTGKTLGIIGMGRIGRMAAKCAKAFGMKIIYYNRNKLSSDLEDGAKYFSDIESMMPECDFVSIHTPATAETTILLILAASRRIGEAYNLVRSGEWKNQKPDLTKFMIGNSVTGKTLGIIGMGRIGRMAANCAKAFGMKIIYYNRNKLSEELEDGAKYFSDINSMMPECDFVSIHTPATAETKHILNVNTIGLLPKHAVVINTSRGSTIDDDALIDALQNNKIYAAGLDVFNNEPNLDERYMKLDNCFVLPHVGSATHETRLAMSMMAVDNICNYFKNKPLISEVV